MKTGKAAWRGNRAAFPDGRLYDIMSQSKV